MLDRNDLDSYPLVTVVTVTYNSAAYVRDAIESVLAQDYPNIEYIVGDDCSTDNTWDIISEYKDVRIKAYRNEENLKEYPNRNKAIELATGEYLLFIDGDDLIFEHGISFFVKYMEKFPEAAIAIQKNYRNNIIYPALLFPNESIQSHCFGGWDLLSSSFASTFFRTDKLKEQKLKESIISGDDEIRLRIAARWPILLLQGWVTWPRETPGQASSRIIFDEALLESYLYTKELFETVSVGLDSRVMEDALDLIKRSISRCMIKLYLKGELVRGRRLSEKSGVSLWDSFRYVTYQPRHSDPLNNYTPSRPYKNVSG